VTRGAVGAATGAGDVGGVGDVAAAALELGVGATLGAAPHAANKHKAIEASEGTEKRDVWRISILG